MCDHCRSATSRMPNGGAMRVPPVQEKAVAFATSSHGSSGGRCGQWKKSCCGGGCCGIGNSNEPCCGMDRSDVRQATGITRQFQQPPNSRSPYGRENHVDYSAYQPGLQKTSCGSGCNKSRNETAPYFAMEPPLQEMGVCPAMMRNLPCTPLPKPKCFGGDCRDDDTDSEDSREI